MLETVVRPAALKRLVWVGSSGKDLVALPPAVIDTFGYGLYLAQIGRRHENSKGDTEARYGTLCNAAIGSSGNREGTEMVKRTKNPTIDFEKGSGNVYADLARADPEALLVKAKLVTRISELLEARALTQTEGALLLGIPQPKLSNLLSGRFRGFSERKLMDFLTRLGSDVEIVVRSDARAGRRGSISVVLAS